MMFASRSAGLQPGMSHFGSVAATNSRTFTGAAPIAAGPAVAPSSMDCGVSQLCQDTAPKAQAKEDQWIYVGEGNGNFEQVSQMQPFMGGSWARKETPSPPFGGCMIFGCIASLLLVAAFAFAIINSFGGGGRKRPIQAEDMRPQFDCTGGLTGGRISDMTGSMLAAKFIQADTSGDGKLSTPEIDDASRFIYPNCFNAEDQDKDGLVDSSEVVSSYPKAHEELLFALADEDCDGRLSAHELKALQDTKTFMPSKLKKYLNQSDVNGDSVLSKDGFVSAIKKFEWSHDNSVLSGYNTWEPDKKQWCCKNQGLACEAEAPHDCKTNDWTWEKAWSSAKKTYCCKHAKIGCEQSATYDCRSQYDNGLQAWSPQKKQFCCSQYGRGCETQSKPYDCRAGLSNWKRGWSLSKKAWCCKNEKLGCEGEHDCFEGYVTWRTSWNDRKKQYCCRTHGRGCADATPAAPGVIYDCQKDWDHWEEKWTAEKKQFCCSQYERGCKAEKQVSEPFDCNAGANNWKKGWSKQKKVYCCQHHDIGCEASSEPFDCDAGANNWEKGWSNPKKVYCCQHHRVGCAPAAPAAAVTSGSEPYDCKAGAWNWKAGWSDKKKAWCCSNKEIACATIPSHDCEAGWYNWQNVWSPEKKTWCCLKEHRGCENQGAPIKL